MSTSGSSGWRTNDATTGLEPDPDLGPSSPLPQTRTEPPGRSPERPAGSRPPERSLDRPPERQPYFPQEGVGASPYSPDEREVGYRAMDERAFRWALYYAERQAAVAYWWGLGAGLALGVLVGSFAAGTTLVAALFHGR